jgi:hypothetical protein
MPNCEVVMVMAPAWAGGSYYVLDGCREEAIRGFVGSGRIAVADQ